MQRKKAPPHTHTERPIEQKEPVIRPDFNHKEDDILKFVDNGFDTLKQPVKAEYKNSYAQYLPYITSFLLSLNHK